MALRQLSIPGVQNATIEITLDGAALKVPAAVSVAEALLLAGTAPLRRSVISGAPRGPYCMMGSCFECLVTINGVADRQSCLVTVTEGMRIERQAPLHRDGDI